MRLTDRTALVLLAALLAASALSGTQAWQYRVDDGVRFLEYRRHLAQNGNGGSNGNPNGGGSCTKTECAAALARSNCGAVARCNCTNNTYNLVVDTSGCSDGTKTISWVCCRLGGPGSSNTPPSSAQAPACSGSPTCVGSPEGDYCNEVSLISHQIDATQQLVTLYFHDGQFLSTLNWTRPYCGTRGNGGVTCGATTYLSQVCTKTYNLTDVCESCNKVPPPECPTLNAPASFSVCAADAGSFTAIFNYTVPNSFNPNGFTAYCPGGDSAISISPSEDADVTTVSVVCPKPTGSGTVRLIGTPSDTRCGKVEANTTVELVPAVTLTVENPLTTKYCSGSTNILVTYRYTVTNSNAVPAFTSSNSECKAGNAVPDAGNANTGVVTFTCSKAGGYASNLDVGVSGSISGSCPATVTAVATATVVPENAPVVSLVANNMSVCASSVAPLSVEFSYSGSTGIAAVNLNNFELAAPNGCTLDANAIDTTVKKVVVTCNQPLQTGASIQLRAYGILGINSCNTTVASNVSATAYITVDAAPNVTLTVADQTVCEQASNVTAYFSYAGSTNINTTAVTAANFVVQQEPNSGDCILTLEAGSLVRVDCTSVPDSITLKATGIPGQGACTEPAAADKEATVLISKDKAPKVNMTAANTSVCETATDVAVTFSYAQSEQIDFLLVDNDNFKVVSGPGRNCEVNVAVTNRTVTVLCTGVTSWSGQPYVTLLAENIPGTDACSSYAGNAVEATGYITVDPRPDVKLECIQNATVCAADGAGEPFTVKFSYNKSEHIDGSDLEVSNFDIVPPTSGCTVTGVNTASREVTISCSPENRPEDFTVTVKTKDIKGLGACTADANVATATAYVIVQPNPVVVLTGGNKQVCESDSSVSVTFSYSGSTAINEDDLAEYCQVDGPHPGDCSIVVDKANRTIVMTCAPAALGSSNETFPLALQCSGIRGIGQCKNKTAADKTSAPPATVTIQKAPKLALSPPANSSKCPGVKEFTVEFTYTKDNTESLPNFTSNGSPLGCGQPEVDAVPGNKARVTCTHPSSSWPAGSYTVYLQGSVKGTAPCTGAATASASTSVTVGAAPSITLSPEAQPLPYVCVKNASNSAVAKFNYVVRNAGSNFTVTGIPTALGSTCEVTKAPTANQATGTFEVTCSPVPADQSLDVTLKATVQNVGCGADGTGTSTGSASNTTTTKGVPFVCCKAGTAFAKGDSQSVCFRNSTLSCGSNNWGFYNQGPQSAKLIAGAGNQECRAGTNVGSVDVKCASNTVTFTVTNTYARYSSIDGQHYYVGCTKPSSCTQPYGATQTKSASCTVTNKETCGGNVPNPLTFKVNLSATTCNCSNFYWVYHESGKDFRGTDGSLCT